MMKRIIALLLALILTVGLLPTVALAAEETANTNVVPGSIGTDGKWSQTPPTQPKVDGVKTVEKTAEKVAGTDNQYKVTLTVVLEQTKEEQKPGAAATVLVLDTSGSMAYCAECGVEEECEHSCEAFDGQVEQNRNYYYKNDKGEYEKAYYCNGKHKVKPKHPAGWFTTSGDDFWNHDPETDSLAGQTIYVESTTPRTSRLDAAKVAAENFLKTYSGLKFNTDGTVAANQTDRNLGRYVSVVTFATGVTLRRDWIDVSNPAGYENVLGVFTGNSLKAKGATNLDAGLTYAEYLLKKNTMKDAAKNVIALTDGEPTYYLSTSYFCNDPECDGVDNRPQIGEEFYYVHGRGDACSTNTKSATDNAANALKNNNFSDLYTICFGVANDKMKQYKDGNSIKYWPNSLTVGQYLQSIASSKAGKQFAYTADNAAQLNTAFAAITDTIVSGLDTGTVNDTLPTGITGSTATANGQAITSPMTWKLDDNDFHVSTNTETEGDKKVTTYTYTKTYYVTIDPETVVKTRIGNDEYAPLNGETTLTVEVAGEEKTIPFPIPAGKVTPKEYTVKGIIYNGGKVNNTDSPYTETVESGKTSKAMTFVPATGYVIDTITEKIGTDEPTSITVSDANKNSYTYDAKTVTADITVTVTTKKRTDLSYTVKYVDKDTNAEIRQSETTSNQQFEAEIDVASMDKLPITGYTYNSCSPTDKLTIGTGENLITLYYTKNKHNINYVYAAGSPQNAPSLDSYNELNVPFGTLKTRKGAPTLDGWTFNGWTTEDVEVAADGTFSMPDKDVTFTGSWTQRATATIAYVVVPNGGGTLSSYSETKYVDDKTAATGSSATPADGYRFVGWYAEEGCTTLLTAESHYTPTKTGDNWTGATYYAKFEAIPKPDADDLPTVTVQCTNGQASHQQSSGKPLVAGTYNTSAVSKDTATGKYTCTITLTDESGYITSYNTETNTTHVADSQNDVTAITMTYDETSKTWSASPANFVINVKCDTPTVNVTYEWTGLDNATFELAVEPKLPSTAKVTKGGKHTVDTNYKAGDIRVATNGDKYRFSGWSTTNATIDVNGEITNIQNNITLTGTWTKLGSGTFDLTDKIFKSFTLADGSSKIPAGTEYTFAVHVTPYGETQGTLHYGDVKLNDVTRETLPSFNFNNVAEIECKTPGTYTYLVEEAFDRAAHPDGIVDKIHYDTKQYLLTIVVDDELNARSYFTALPQTDGAELMPTITFENKYDEDPNADIVTLDLSKYVTKTFESRHGKSAAETFEAKVQIWLDDVPIITNAAAEEDSIAVYAEPEWPKEYTGTVTLSTGETKHFDFGGSITLDRNHRYRIRVTETAGSNTDVEYDKTVYETYVNFDYETKEVKWYEYNGNFSFTNTYTGIDDYYPIIIPTIINKDTGMLNKTDHFAYVIGYPDGTVHPNGQITRAEVATIFFRLLRDEVRDGAFTTSNSYSDVAYGKWYNNPISTMSALGIITGYPDGTFKPNKPITRAEFAAIAARFDETQSGKSATFSDVIGHWAAKEIGIAYYNDWIKGYPDGTFKPDQNITRAEAMTLINRVLERKPESPADLLTNMNKWTDNLDTSKWYYLDVQEATNSHGYTRKTFNYELWRQMLPDPDWSRYER